MLQNPRFTAFTLFESLKELRNYPKELKELPPTKIRVKANTENTNNT